MFSQHFVKSRFSIWTSPSPLVPVPWHNCKIEVSLYYSPPHRLSLKWIKRHCGGKVAFNEQLMNSQKCNWYTCDSIAFIALLFDGLLVNADKRKNLAISKPERAKNGRKKWQISNLLKTTTSTFRKTYRLSWQNVKVPVLLNPQSHAVFKPLFSICFPCYLGNWTFHCTLKAVH